MSFIFTDNNSFWSEEGHNVKMVNKEFKNGFIFQLDNFNWYFKNDYNEILISNSHHFENVHIISNNDFVIIGDDMTFYTLDDRLHLIKNKTYHNIKYFKLENNIELEKYGITKNNNTLYILDNQQFVNINSKCIIELRCLSKVINYKNNKNNNNSFTSSIAMIVLWYKKNHIWTEVDSNIFIKKSNNKFSFFSNISIIFENFIIYIKHNSDIHKFAIIDNKIVQIK